MLDQGIAFPSLEGIRATVELSAEDMYSALAALESAWPPYIDTARTMAGPGRVGGHVVSVSERARRELGTWPSVDGVVQAIIDALGQAADAAEEPDTKGRLRAAADVVAGIGRDVLTQVVAAKIGSAT